MVTSFDKPYLFSYGSWDKIAIVANGQLVVQTPNAQGGLGDNFGPINWSAKQTFSPVLHLRVGVKNQLKTIRLMLGDGRDKISSTWNYSLEGLKAGEDRVLVPLEGASLGEPSSAGDKGSADLSKVSQWQIQGDWSGGAVDATIDKVEIVSADAKILALRAEKGKRIEAERVQKLKDQEAMRAQYPRGANSPVVTSLTTIAPDILALEINSGHVLPASLTKYVKQADDRMREEKNGSGFLMVHLSRGGKEIGYLIGPKRDWLQVPEGYGGDPLLEFEADNAENYVLSSSDDARFSVSQKLKVVGRKSTPTRWALGSDKFEIRHTIYLRAPQTLGSSKKYSLALGKLNTKQSSFAFANDAAKNRSDAVHVNQIGFRPDDPAKFAFVSCWMGTGGALALPANIKFSVVNDKTGAIEYSNSSSDIWRADKPETMQTEAKFNGTDVARLDFSAFKKAGVYRVVVDGIGASYPFPIGTDVWTKAFLVQMKGLYNQRSGMELGPPDTTFKKPRDLFPGDAGVKITQSTYRFNGGDGKAKTLKEGDTGVAVTNAWGGYHDAGDWNPRRITHMSTTLAMLESLEMSPQVFSSLKFNIPQDGPASKNTPDILREAIWEFECFHRMQRADGGVNSTIETDGDPIDGEVSWLQSMPMYVAAPDYYNNWFYAAVGARLSRLLKPYDVKLAATYRASAIKAFAWAESDWKKEVAAKRDKGGEVWKALDSRNLAAVELLKLTGEKTYHDIFLQNTVLTQPKPDLFIWSKAVQREQAFVYATLPNNLGDAALKKKAVAAIEAMANRAIEYSKGNAWGLTSGDKGKPQFLGFYSMADSADLTRAHFLTKKPQYLAGAVQAALFAAGANPNNIVYTSGVGANPIRFPFKVDAEKTGQPMPIGLTVYGNVDFTKWGDQQWITWPVTWFFGKNTTPHPLSWPSAEAYWDTGGWPALQEFTIDAWSPNVLSWGYLAGR